MSQQRALELIREAKQTYVTSLELSGQELTAFIKNSNLTVGDCACGRLVAS